MSNKNNAQLVYKVNEKNGKKYTNFYLRLGNGLLNVAIDVKSFGDNSIYGRIKHYCDETNKDVQ